MSTCANKRLLTEVIERINAQRPAALRTQLVPTSPGSGRERDPVARGVRSRVPIDLEESHARLG